MDKNEVMFFSLFITVFLSQIVGAAGEVAIYNLDGNANDASGNNNHGTVYGGATYTTNTPDGSSYALSFDGTDDYVSAPDSPGFTTPNALTVEAWVKENSLGFYGVVTRHQGGVDNDGSWVLGLSSGSVLFHMYPSGTDYELSSTGVISAGSWFHIAATWDGSTKIIYINGVASGSQSATTTLGDAATPFEIGRYHTSSGGGAAYWFNGVIDKVRVYNRALSASEIMQHYCDVVGCGTTTTTITSTTTTTTTLSTTTTTTSSTTTTTISSNAVAIYNLDGNANDASGNNNHGTVYGGATYTTNTPDGSSYALSFDGTDDYVSAPDSPGFTTPNALTVEAWVKENSLGFYGVVTRHQGGVDNDGSWVLGLSSGSVLFHMYPSGTDYELSSTGVISAGSWFHIAATWDGSTKIIYINGVASGSQSATTTLGDAATPFEIGRYHTSSGGGAAYWFNGVIDKVRVYNRALSASEIMQHYQEGTERTSLSCTGDSSHNCGGSSASVSSIDTVSAPSAAGAGDSITVTVDWTGWHWNDDNHFAFFMKPTSGGSWEYIDSCKTNVADDNIDNRYTMNCLITIPSSYSGEYYIRVTSNDDPGYCNPGETNVDAEGSTTITVAKVITTGESVSGNGDMYYKYTANSATPVYITLTMEMTADYDLYVKWDGGVPSLSNWDCRPYYEDDWITEVCDKDSVNGDIYIYVDDYWSESKEFQIRVDQGGKMCVDNSWSPTKWTSMHEISRGDVDVIFKQKFIWNQPDINSFKALNSYYQYEVRRDENTWDWLREEECPLIYGVGWTDLPSPYWYFTEESNPPWCADVWNCCDEEFQVNAEDPGALQPNTWYYVEVSFKRISNGNVIYPQTEAEYCGKSLGRYGVCDAGQTFDTCKMTKEKETS